MLIRSLDTNVEVLTAALVNYHLIFSPKAVGVHLVDVCKSVGEVNIAVSEGEREVLISDALAEALGIQLVDIARGLWRYRDDPPYVIRESVRAEYW